MAAVAGMVGGRTALAVARGWRGAVGEQRVDGVVVAVAGGEHERGPSSLVAPVDARARPEQDVHDHGVPAGGGGHQGGRAAPGPGVDRRAAIEEKADDPEVSFRRGEHERGHAGVVGRVGLGAVIEKRADDREPAVFGRIEERRRSAEDAKRRLDSAFEKRLDGGRVPASDRIEERFARIGFVRGRAFRSDESRRADGLAAGDDQRGRDRDPGSGQEPAAARVGAGRGTTRAAAIGLEKPLSSIGSSISNVHSSLAPSTRPTVRGSTRICPAAA